MNNKVLVSISAVILLAALVVAGAFFLASSNAKEIDEPKPKSNYQDRPQEQPVFQPTAQPIITPTPALCKFKPGDLIQSVMSAPEEGHYYKGQVQYVLGADPKNNVCKYTILYYLENGNTSSMDEWEFEMRPQ